MGWTELAGSELAAAPEFGCAWVCGYGAGRPNGRVIPAPGDSLSVLTCSEASLHGRSRGGGMAGGEELSAPVKLGLRGAKEAGKRGETLGGSQRCRRDGRRARGSPVDDESAATISGARR